MVVVAVIMFTFIAVVAFRCCYCYVLNPARRQRPRAPQLNLGTPRRTPENVSAEGLCHYVCRF